MSLVVRHYLYRDPELCSYHTLPLERVSTTPANRQIIDSLGNLRDYVLPSNFR